ncbi:MAG: 1-acyl-sn-glycerol-3-phosphate acyltransferase [Bacteroidales bacterium]
MEKYSQNNVFSYIFRIYSGIILKWHFREIKIFSDIEFNDRPVLLVSNHFGWWDSFIIWHLNRNFIKKKFHLLLAESDLKNQSYLSKIGAFTISKTSRGLYNSLIYAANLLNEDNNVVAIFPQGKMFSQHHLTLEFTREVERLLQDRPKCRIVMAANLIDYYGFKKPTLSIYLNEYLYDDGFNLTQFQFAYNMFLKQSIYQQDKLFK